MNPENQSLMPRVMFYFDLGSPYAYLAAERLTGLLPEPVDWQPVLLGGIFKLTGRSSWSLGNHQRRRAGMADVERRARSYGLPPMRWPDPWPTNYLMAMRAATFAVTVGRGREFALAAFRAAFQHGAELGEPNNVLRAAQQAGLDRQQLEAGSQQEAIKRKLLAATESAYEAGVIGVPTIAVDAQLFWGDDRLQEAAAHLSGVTAA